MDLLSEMFRFPVPLMGCRNDFSYALLDLNVLPNSGFARGNSTFLLGFFRNLEIVEAWGLQSGTPPPSPINLTKRVKDTILII